MESILLSIKKLLGAPESYEDYDTDIIIHINSVLMILEQLGVGVEGFAIEDDSATWDDFFGEQHSIEGVKSYVYMKVKLIFDPPQSGILRDSYQKLCDEFEWRLNVQVDPSQQKKEG